MELPDLPPRAQGPPIKVPNEFKKTPVNWIYTMQPTLYQGRCGGCWAFSIAGML